MNVFDVIGPVMIGPSSSHTAGAVRLGLITQALLGEPVIDAVIELHGSFARTYRGHGTDKAIVGGLLGIETDDERIRNSMDIASSQGLFYRFEVVELKDAHPNTAIIEVTGQSGKSVSVLGSSVGGGNILIRRINHLGVEVTAQYETIIVAHTDTPGAVAAVTDLLAKQLINIAQMKVYRSNRGGEAMMVIETDQTIDPALSILLGELLPVRNVTVIEPI